MRRPGLVRTPNDPPSPGGGGGREAIAWPRPRTSVRSPPGQWSVRLLTGPDADVARTARFGAAYAFGLSGLGEDPPPHRNPLEGVGTTPRGAAKAQGTISAFCTECGHPFDDSGANFCEECGAARPRSNPLNLQRDLRNGPSPKSDGETASTSVTSG